MGAGRRLRDRLAAGELLVCGCNVVGIELSVSGIESARCNHPSGRFVNLASSKGLFASQGETPFDAVVSTEVVEHLYATRPYACECYEAIRPAGRVVRAAPYHGYLNKLAISVCGKWDSHVNPLWVGGHIKLRSGRRLSPLLTETGLRSLHFAGIGRLP